MSMVVLNKKPMDIISFILIPTYLLFLSPKVSFAQDSINQSQFISEANTLVSKDGSFELGFFSPGSSNNRYLGIWYKNIPVKTIVWVANRLYPINDSSGLLMINSSGGSVVLMSQNKSAVVWSTSSQRQANNPLLQLLDSGNLVLTVTDEKDENLRISLWESFEYPTDTFLPGMKFGWDLKKGINRLFTAWKKPDDPSPGDFTHGLSEMGIHSYPEPYVWKGNKKFYRSGPWNGLRFSGSPDLNPNPVYDYIFVSNENEVYFTYTLRNKSLISRVVVNQTSHTRDRYTWIETEKVWRVYSSRPRDYCDNYGLCGANGNCVLTASPVCQCLKAFKPKSPELWSLMEWSQGCVRNKPLSCYTDGFLKFVDLKLPDTTYSWVNKSMSLEECRVKCLKNCSCMAYTNSDISGGGSGCAIWFGDLMDIRQFPAGGQDLYIRMSASELLGSTVPRRTPIHALCLRSKQGAWRREELRSTLSVSDPSREHGAKKNSDPRSLSSIRAGSTAPRRTFDPLSLSPIQARREELRSKHGEKNVDPSTPIHHKRRSTLSVSDPSTTRTPIQARREERRSKHADLPQVPIHSLCLRWNDQRPRAGVVGVVNGIDADLGIPLKDHVTPSFNLGQLHCPEQSISFNL
uniref:non-specific serine/threonine protein kinase n=1 Tax=Quercus lobata TaxID=97700 RepID=A0A7N2L2Q6_QUELO